MKAIFFLIILFFFSVYSYSQDCDCPDLLYSSSKYKPLIEIGPKNNKLFVCGFSGIDLINGFKTGVLLKDSSMYLSGFSIFTYKDTVKLLTNISEIDICRLRQFNDSLTIEYIEEMPVDSGLKLKYSPLVSFAISRHKNEWVIGESRMVLDYSDLTEADFKKIEMELGWGKNIKKSIFPKDEYYNLNLIRYAFVLSLKEYPKYNKAYKNYGDFSGSFDEEIHYQLYKILTMRR